MRAIELEGKLEADPQGSCPTVRFVVKDRTVYTTSGTTYARGKCGDLKKKTEVEIRGMLMSDNTVRADWIKVEDDDD